LYNDLNIHSLVERKVMPNGQIKSDIDIAPLALGGMTYGVSVYELTAAYAIFVNKGVYSKPRSYTVVKDQNNNIVLENLPDQKVVISEDTAYIMTLLLKNVVESGTAKGLPMARQIEVAGKTGTTNEDYDRWFVGYTPYYLCGSWFGFDQPKYLGVDRGSGNPPLMLFNYVMNAVHEKYNLYDDPVKEFEIPPTIVEASYCRISGMAPVPGGACWWDKGLFAKGEEPNEPCDAHEETTEEPTEETTEEPTTEPPTEPPTEPATEPPITEPPTEPPTEPTTEPPTEPTTEPPITEPPTEHPTEPPVIITEAAGQEQNSEEIEEGEIND